MLKENLLNARRIEKEAKEQALKAGEEKYSLQQLRSVALFEDNLEEVTKLSEEIELIRPQVFNCWTNFYKATLNLAKVEKEYLLAEDAQRLSKEDLKLLEHIYDKDIQRAENQLKNHINKESYN